MFVDFSPGTDDIQLSTIQKLNLAENGSSVFSQPNKQVMDSFEKIAELIISKTGIKS